MTDLRTECQEVAELAFAPRCCGLNVGVSLAYQEVGASGND